MEKYQARPVNSNFLLVQQDPRNTRLGGFRTARFALIIMEHILTNKIVKPYIEISAILRNPSYTEVDGIVLREAGTAVLI